ncbi:MAG TPA: protein kinase [Planctomycetota bacterium]|nr:protein kinase [Planctomycetota bacterium]
MADSAPNRNGENEAQLEALIAECLEAQDSERSRRLEEACAAHPELEAGLRERARLLQAFGFAFERQAPVMPSVIGDFTIVRRIGQGGMGVVFEARQAALGRSVALKLIRPDLVYFEGARERFQREALAIAKLSHPNIVPIYMVGEEGGMPYFAMELVRGCTLDQALAAVADRAPESLSGADLAAVVEHKAGMNDGDSGGARGSSIYSGTWIEACVGIVRQIASALEHAHDKEIIHRDVKPSNIALASDGRARLLDFGLTSRSDANRLTRSGAQVGTILYMPPEQMQKGGAIDGRADVYSLGVVLYEMLTLQLPFRGDDALSIMHAALDARPDPIRARNRRVPPDLETVCLVAMDPEPSRRYASAAALGRDLENVLARRAIEARPPGAFVRAKRFAQRHPARAVSIVLGLALVGGIPLALLAQKTLYASKLEASLTRAKQADAEKTIALEKERNASFEMQRSLDFVTGLFLRGAPSVARGEDFTLRDVLELGAAEVKAGLEGHPLATARIQMSIGLALLELGANELARKQFEDASAVYATQAPPEDHVSYARAQRLLGDALRAAGDGVAATQAYDRALATLRLSDEGAADQRAQALAARAWIRAGSGELESARADLEEARSIAAAVDSVSSQSLARFDLRFASLYAAQKKFAEASVLVDSALRSLREEPGRKDPGIVEALNLRGYVDKNQGNLSAAEAAYTEALDCANLFWRKEGTKQAELYLNLAAVAGACGESAREVSLLRRALVIFEREVGSAHTSAALCGGNLAGTLARQGRFPEAEEIYPRVIAMQSEAYGPRHVFVGFSLKNLAACAKARGDSRRAADLYYEAGRILLDVAGQSKSALDALAASANQSMQLGATKAAEEVLREAIAESERLLPAMSPALYGSLAASLEAQGRPDEAEACRARAAQN